jgi:GNAT superfamily N-acetyltransferase
LWKDRDVDEDDSFWLVPCFFVRRSARGHGITRVLLSAAVELAAAHGAAGIEGFPRSGHAQVDAASAYLGTEPLFESCGFAAARRPSDKRVMMRLTFGA